MEMLVLIKLLAAHVVGDFFLQCETLCEGKKNLCSPKGWVAQIGHALVHALLAYLFVAEWSCWLLPLVIFVTHLFIDLAKSRFGKDNTVSFVADQILHIVVLLISYLFILNTNLPQIDIPSDKVWGFALAYFLVLKPTSVFIGIFNKRFESKQEGKSLPQGGTVIGCLERVLILTFIFSGWMEGIGYLLAAKSVFRFGDLKNNSELKHTEYVLVGTLMSFVIALLAGVVARYGFNLFFA